MQWWKTKHGASRRAAPAPRCSTHVRPTVSRRACATPARRRLHDRPQPLEAPVGAGAAPAVDADLRADAERPRRRVRRTAARGRRRAAAARAGTALPTRRRPRRVAAGARSSDAHERLLASSCSRSTSTSSRTIPSWKRPRSASPTATSSRREAGLLEVLTGPGGSRVDHDETWLDAVRPVPRHRPAGPLRDLGDRFRAAASAGRRRSGSRCPKLVAAGGAPTSVRSARASTAQVGWTCPATVGTPDARGAECGAGPADAAALGARLGQAQRRSTPRPCEPPDQAVHAMGAQPRAVALHRRRATLEKVLQGRDAVRRQATSNPALVEAALEVLRVMHRARRVRTGRRSTTASPTKSRRRRGKRALRIQAAAGRRQLRRRPHHRRRCVPRSPRAELRRTATRATRLSSQMSTSRRSSCRASSSATSATPWRMLDGKLGTAPTSSSSRARG